MPLNLTTDKVLINHKPDHFGCGILMSCHALWQDQLWNIPISWQNSAVICKGSLPNAWSRSGALHTLQQCCVPIFLQYSNLSSRIERCFYIFPFSFLLVLIIIYDRRTGLWYFQPAATPIRKSKTRVQSPKADLWYPPTHGMK